MQVLEVWEKDNGHFLGEFDLIQIVRNPVLRGGLLYGFLMALNSEGVVTL